MFGKEAFLAFLEVRVLVRKSWHRTKRKIFESILKFAYSRKAPFIFVMSVCPSASMSGHIFMTFHIRDFDENLSRKSRFG
jgi:membrane-anchored glycerophosphoryl diester phosphodiesterase (GDPDase)